MTVVIGESPVFTVRSLEFPAFGEGLSEECFSQGEGYSLKTAMFSTLPRSQKLTKLCRGTMVILNASMTFGRLVPTILNIPPNDEIIKRLPEIIKEHSLVATLSQLDWAIKDYLSKNGGDGADCTGFVEDAYGELRILSVHQYPSGNRCAIMVRPHGQHQWNKGTCLFLPNIQLQQR